MSHLFAQSKSKLPKSWSTGASMGYNRFDILERSNSGEGDWVEVNVVVVYGGGVELEGLEEPMDCGFDTMWD